MKTLAVVMVLSLLLWSPLVFMTGPRPPIGAIFRRRLREGMRVAKLTQATLSEALGLTQGQVSRIMNFDHVAAQVKLNQIVRS